MPAMYYYDPGHMKPSKRDAFLKWYNERVAENYVFDFQKKLKDYCRSDIDILRRGMLVLRDNFIEIANIDSFQYITIASVYIPVYRSKYMPEKTIGVIKYTPKKIYLVKFLFSGYNGIQR